MHFNLCNLLLTERKDIDGADSADRAAIAIDPKHANAHSILGVLLLSEFAGSAQSLGGAIRVNPWNTEELATAIETALNLSPVERELRHHKVSDPGLGHPRALPPHQPLTKPLPM